MALKTAKTISDKQRKLVWFRLEIARRKPSYLGDLTELFRKMKVADKSLNLPTDHKNTLSDETVRRRRVAHDKLTEAFLTKYNIPILYLPDITQKEITHILAVGMSVMPDVNADVLKDRFINFRVDTSMDIEVLKNSLAARIKSIFEQRKREAENSARLLPKETREGLLSEQKTHRFMISNYERCLKIFDMRNAKPPLPYSKIVSQLMKEGQYAKQSIDQALNLACKEFTLIFKEIYGIPRRNYDSKKITPEKFNRCATCPQRSSCKELCAEAEWYVSGGSKNSQKEQLTDVDKMSGPVDEGGRRKPKVVFDKEGKSHLK